MDEFSSGDQAPEWTSSSSDDSIYYEDEDSHQGVENTDNIESSIEKDDDKVTTTMLWSSEFDEEVHAYKAYIKYARDMGFVVRKRDLSRDEDVNLNRRYYVCNCQGTRDPKHYRLVDRKRNHKPETRIGCKAHCSVYLDKLSMKWRVKTLEEEHNHPMIPEQFVHLISSYRKLTEADKVRIVCMKEPGFQTSQIVGVLAKLAGGYDNLNFMKKDVYNFIDRDRRAKIENGDAAAAISINSFLKRFIKSRKTLLELVENLERVVKEYRNNEFVAQFKSMYSKPVLTTGLDSIEQAAARVYTTEVFVEVKDQLAKVAALKHVGKSGMGSNVVHCVANLDDQRWRKDAKAYLNEEVDDGKDPKRAFSLRVCSPGAPKLNKKFKGLKTRNCSRCGKTGHTRRTCHNVESKKQCSTGDNGSEGQGHGSRFETGRHNSHDDDVVAKQGSLSSKFGLYSTGCDEVASDSLKNICKNSIPNYIIVPKQIFFRRATH
ncbi:hypothetical protein Ahy_B07g087223 [Arachis hypogaea]|uniref:Uncharacterized protein n=1 Tax=Arachis hypogaea TaxID=3818 RepID=A0A444YBN7_ARAHY|nr:hypothetical protein Ahy_B07g087223 [Arachis hypogaea]